MFKTILEKLFGIPRETCDILMPQQWKDKFEIVKLKEKKKEWILELVEKKDQIPPEAKDKKVVLNGYKETIEIIDFPFKGKIMYHRFKRRRWIDKSTGDTYYNTYDLHPKGMKTTYEFADFLKELDRDERANFWTAFEISRPMQ